MLKIRAGARRALDAPDLSGRPWRERVLPQRTAVMAQFLTVFRTDADLRTLDTSLDPSERAVGSLLSARPDLSNYMESGLARVCTPRAWLSTWSGLSSNSDLVAAAPKITIPALVVFYRGDNAAFPGDAQLVYDSLGSADKQLVSAPGNHYGFVGGDRRGGLEAVGHLVGWLKERLPV
jgi:pimeloyl-ACP methyl ester carboxylesterase